jgi:hypothetical protein
MNKHLDGGGGGVSHYLERMVREIKDDVASLRKIVQDLRDTILRIEVERSKDLEYLDQRIDARITHREHDHDEEGFKAEDRRLKYLMAGIGLLTFLISIITIIVTGQS